MVRFVLWASDCRPPQQISLGSPTRQTRCSSTSPARSEPSLPRCHSRLEMGIWLKRRIQSYQLQRYFATGSRVEGLMWVFLERPNSTSLQTSTPLSSDHIKGLKSAYREREALQRSDRKSVVSGKSGYLG